LPTALQLYKKLMASHTGAPEAGYARVRLGSSISTGVEPIRTAPLAPELTA
jgi:hypothetical protein